MKKILLLSLFFLIFINSKSQVIDDFNDGNFSDNPTWQGDDSLWQVNTNFQLQSKGTTGTAKDIYLITQNAIQTETEWKFKIRFNFSPSSQNFCRYYLTSDQTNLKGNLNGYYVQFGGSTSNTDTISLYKQIGTSRIRIIAGRPATVAKTNNIIDIKVNRDSIGNWFLYSDTLATNNYLLEGNVFDTTFKTSLYTGIFARFTTGNISNFYLDDVYIGKPIVDTVSPKIESFFLVNDSILQINFNEAINDLDASNILNFELDNAFPSLVKSAIGGDNKSIILNFETSFISGNSYNLSIKNINDLNVNKLADTTLNFVFYKPNIDDIVINEIMPDPSPSNGLPDAEFIELYNRSNFDIEIGGWKINDLSTSATLPLYKLKAKEYVIITNPANENLFKSYGNTLAVPFLPGLNNDGDLVQLMDNKNVIINQIKYDLNWYNNMAKKDGGWSLELINPFTLCKGIDNWVASESPVGGTPGKVNFFSSFLPDASKPIIKSWFYTNDQNLTLVFNEKMDSIKMQNVKLNISNNSISSIDIKGSKSDSVLIAFINPLINKQNYTLQIDSAFDCVGNKIANNTAINFTFIPVKVAQQNDIIISEISSNPIENVALPNAEYVELYNRSSNIILLNNFKIKSGSSITNIGNYQLYPDSFIVLCDDSKLSAFSSFKNVISVPSLPTLSLDDEIVLLNENNNIINQVAYKQSWYNNNVKADGGWSLEMIDLNNPCGTASNWTASVNAGGGTIGFKNSVHGINKDNASPSLTRIYPINSNSVVLFFNETLDSLSVCNKNNFKFNPSILGDYSFTFNDDFLTQLVVSFTDSIKQNTPYTLILDSAKDCSNNYISVDFPIDFGLCKQADTNDIAINEILFNPNPNGVDFVEIYNKTNQFIDVKNLWIGNRNANSLIENFYPLAQNGYMLLPNSYYVITTNQSFIKQQYNVVNKNNFIEVNGMPSLNDDEGTCVLFSKPETIFDELQYNDKMHFTLIDNKEGISLERIDFFRATNDKNNWTSAASTSGFATPTYKNSQFLKVNIGNELLNIEPEVFSPNNDGVNDLVNISYKFNKNNNTATLNIYNSNGILVKTLLNNAPLGTEGVITWNGLSNSNDALPVGIYIVNFEYFNVDGSTENIKKTLVIGSSF